MGGRLVSGAALGLLLLWCGPSAAQASDPTPVAASAGAAPEKEIVEGIGGVFFRARDPESLAAWYDEHLGVSPVPAAYDQQPWRQRAGPTVFAPFAADTEYFGDPAQSWMINFRVRDLVAFVRQLRAAGIAVELDPQQYPNGTFARLEDPEGNPVQLWQPAESNQQ